MGVKFVVKVDGKQIESVVQKLNAINNKNWMPVFMTTVANYLLGYLKEYAPWKRVTRKSVYGSTFFSGKQQRAFFAKLKSGEINVPYIRTGAQGKAWRYEGIKSNMGIVANRDKSVGRTRGQTRLHGKMGWPKAIDTAKKNIKGAAQAGKSALLAYLNSRHK